MEKDYSLLRPFDLEAAKRGEKICFSDGKGSRDFVAGISPSGKFILQCEEGEFHLCSNEFAGWKMAPLAWVEGRPVYRGDVLYYTRNTGRMDGPIEMHITSSDKHGLYGNTVLGEFVGNFEHLTWQKPKTKREGWMNCYKSGENYVYQSKEAADANANKWRTTCVRIEWEE